MAFERGPDGSDPIRHVELRRAPSGLLATGTLACPGCDAPVAPGPRALTLVEPLGCPFCGHAGAVRDFLSLAAPTRPARVEVRLKGSWSRA